MMGRNIAVAITFLLFSGGVFAQAPPAQDTEQRLRALEAKMDRVLTVLESRQKPQPTQEDVAKQIQLLMEAKERLLDSTRAKDRQYADFRLQTRSGFERSGEAAQRLSKDRSVLQDLRQRQSELSARSSLVKQAGDSEKQVRALLVLLQRRGVDLGLLRKTAGGRDDGSPQELLQLYAESLRLESIELEQLAADAAKRLTEDQKLVRDRDVYEMTEHNLRESRDRTQKMLDDVFSQLEKIDVMRGLQNQPKP
jgi:hypothetical protein